MYQVWVSVDVDEVPLINMSYEAPRIVRIMLMDEVNMKDLCKVISFLKMDFIWNMDRVCLCLKKVTEVIIERFGYRDCRPVLTPMVSERHQRNEDSRLLKGIDVTNCKRVISALLFLDTQMRLDIATSVSIAGRKEHDPSVIDWLLWKRIFQYLRGTNEL